MTKVLGYFEPLIEFATYNTLVTVMLFQLFIVAFIFGPFLFGYLFSRSKQQKLDQAAAVQK